MRRATGCDDGWVNQPDQPSAAPRSLEERIQRRGIVITTVVCMIVTAGLVALAVLRVDSSQPTDTRIAVLASNEGSTTPSSTSPITAAPTTVAPGTTTPTTTAPTTTVPTTVAPTTVPATTPTTVAAAVVPPAAPAPAILWTATPSTVTLKAGTGVSVRVQASNYGTADGAVTTPSCPSPPQSLTPTTQQPSGVCIQGGQLVTIAPRHYEFWDITLSATSDGTAKGQPLAPGAYRVMIGGATVNLTVTP